MLSNSRADKETFDAIADYLLLKEQSDRAYLYMCKLARDTWITEMEQDKAVVISDHNGSTFRLCKQVGGFIKAERLTTKHVLIVGEIPSVGAR